MTSNILVVATKLEHSQTLGIGSKASARVVEASMHEARRQLPSFDDAFLQEGATQSVKTGRAQTGDKPNPQVDTEDVVEKHPDGNASEPETGQIARPDKPVFIVAKNSVKTSLSQEMRSDDRQEEDDGGPRPAQSKDSTEIPSSAQAQPIEARDQAFFGTPRETGLPALKPAQFYKPVPAEPSIATPADQQVSGSSRSEGTASEAVIRAPMDVAKNVMRQDVRDIPMARDGDPQASGDESTRELLMTLDPGRRADPVTSHSAESSVTAKENHSVTKPGSDTSGMASPVHSVPKELPTNATVPLTSAGLLNTRLPAWPTATAPQARDVAVQLDDTRQVPSPGFSRPELPPRPKFSLIQPETGGNPLNRSIARSSDRMSAIDTQVPSPSDVSRISPSLGNYQPALMASSPAAPNAIQVAPLMQAGLLSSEEIVSVEVGMQTDALATEPRFLSVPEGSRLQDPMVGARIHSLPEARQTDIARTIAVQISQNAGGGQGSVVELQLAPEELGALKFRMSLNDGGITIVVHADKPETQDLLRRHMEQLEAQFASLGFGEASISFAEREQAGTEAEVSKDPTERIDAATDDPAAIRHSDTPMTRIGIDMRV